EHNIDLNFATQNNLYPINILSFCQDKDCKNSACLVSAPIICSVYGNSGIDVVFLVNKRRIQSLITDLSNSSYQGQMILLNQNPIFEHGTMTSTEKYNYTTLATNTNMSYSFSFLEPHIPFWSDNIFMSFIFIFIGCSIVGIVLSMLFSNPLYRMYLRLYQTQNKEDQMIVRRHIFANPAAVFESYVDRIVTSHERLTTKVGQYRSIIDNNNLLLSILLTEDAENYLDEIIEICPWFSEEGIYSILLINETDSKKSETTVGKFLSEIFDNYQLCGSLNYHFMNILSCDFALLLSHSTQNADIVLNKLCTEIETTVSNVIIAPGSTAQGIIGIQTSYHQARKILQQRIFNTTEVIEGYFFPVNLEFQLMNSLKSADCEKSKNILSTAFQQNDNLNLSTVQMKKFYQVIFESFERFAKENEYDIKPTKKQFIHSLDTNFKDIREIFFSLCSELSDFTVKKLDEGVQQLGIEIYNYIKNNFADVNICTDSIANHFHISRSALYKIMRSISEVSLTDLINKLRINKATTLLEESSDTITNISKQVGYDSYCTFKRVFIKNTGISPSEYKLEGRLQVHRKSASQHSGAGGSKY
ncbi:MAG: AraC family transcriptional regulator, partial [Oscillospiraceae bacterium]